MRILGCKNGCKRHLAAGGSWGVGVQPFPILPGQCRGEVSKAESFPLFSCFMAVDT